MKKIIKRIVIFVILIVCICVVKEVYANNSEKVVVKNWTSLKNIIENNELSDIEIQLSNEESNTWIADSKITVKNQKKITLTANSSITIKRDNNFLDCMIENNGNLSMMTSSNDINIILDGNKENVQTADSLITTIGGTLNINNVTLQNNNKNGDGGAIYASDTQIDMNNITLSENTADFGGAIYISTDTSSTKLNNVKILNNKALKGSGGGIYSYGNLIISGQETLISNNTANTYGGGAIIKNVGTLNAGQITNNQALLNSGGGIRVDGTLTMNGGTVKDNTAKITGGGIDWSNSDAKFIFNSGMIEKNIANGGKDAGYNTYQYNWKEEENLNLKEIDTKFIRKYLKGSGKDIDIKDTGCGLQGVTASDKYIIMALVYSDNSLNTNMVIIDKKTKDVLNVDNNYCFGHANGMTYNPLNDRFYVAYYDANDNKNYIANFKISASHKIVELVKIPTSKYYGKIAYNADKNCFICGRNKTICIMDEHWNEVKSFDVYITIAIQDITYYKDYIYVSAWESGSSKYHKVYNEKEKNSNLVYVYNLNGELKETLYLPNTKINSELEDVYIEKNGEMVLAFNGPSLYKSNYLMEKIKPEVTIDYSTEKITNQDVIVTISANEEVEPIEGWQLSSNKTTLSKTYQNNTLETVKVSDLAGNVTEAIIKIENIDKQKPVLNIEYNTTKATNTDVVVTVSSNEELQTIDGWNLSNDKKLLTKIYAENKTENIDITDLAGNVSTMTIDVKNIDKEKPIIEIKYSTKEKTLNDVTVTIESNEELNEIEGWVLSDNRKVLTKTYTQNNEEKITIYDIAGNSIEKNIIVDNIDIKKPEYQVEYSTTLNTNEDVIVTITSDEEMQSIEGWTLSDNKKVLTKKYTKNTEEEVIIKDIIGNTIGKTIITINNIDKTIPQIKKNYNIKELTNQDVIATITANEPIKEIEGWTLSEDKRELTKLFTQNVKEKITISDLAGNVITDTIEIRNIDKTAPKIDVVYSTTLETNNDVIVTIKSDKTIKNISGWTLSSDRKQLTKTFKENGEEDITITDDAENNVTTKVKVSNIIKNKISITQIETKQVNVKTNAANDENKQVNVKTNASNDENKQEKLILPYTGEKSILIFLGLFIIISTAMYIKIKKYKGI